MSDMSEGIKLPDVLKGATEATSLVTTDRLVAFGSNGELKKITIANAVKKRAYIYGISSPQWVRVASFGGSVGALIAIESSWHNVPGNRILIDCFLHPNSLSYNSITTLSQMANSANKLLNKCRVVVKKNSVCYFDIYYDATSQEQVFVKVVQGEYFTTLAEPIAGAEIPEGYTAKEFVFSENFRGGVKRYASISYKSMKGGGLRHERRSGEDERCVKRSTSEYKQLLISSMRNTGRACFLAADYAKSGEGFRFRQCHEVRELQIGSRLFADASRNKFPRLHIVALRLGCKQKVSNPVRIKGNILQDESKRLESLATVFRDNSLHLAGKGVAA